MTKFTYFVKDQQSVTALMEDITTDLSLELAKSFRRVGIKPSDGFNFFRKRTEKFFAHRPTKIRAKAKRDPNDTWDEALGTDIARARLMVKVHGMKVEFYDQLLDQLFYLQDELEARREYSNLKWAEAEMALETIHEEIKEEG